MAIIQSQQEAYRACLGQIEGLVSLKTSPGNRDGSLLSDAEYAERRGGLMKEKAALEGLLNGAGQAQPLKLSIQTFEFACLVKERFAKGNPTTKKEILTTMSSNLILKDKKLLIEAKKPFFILGNESSLETPQIKLIEPKKTQMEQWQNIPTLFLSPLMRGEGDDVRTYLQKAQRAAALIYAHFKKEFKLPGKN